MLSVPDVFVYIVCAAQISHAYTSLALSQGLIVALSLILHFLVRGSDDTSQRHSVPCVGIEQWLVIGLSLKRLTRPVHIDSQLDFHIFYNI